MKKLIGILGTQIILFFFNSSFELLISSSGSGQIIKLVNKTITLKVLLVEFQDVKHRSPEYPKSLTLPAYTYNDFENLFFSENQYCSPRMYSPDGEKVFGSLRDYYRIMSNNTLGIEGYILNRDLNNDNIPDWIMLDNNKSYYNNNRGNIFRDEAKEKAKKIGLNLDVDKNNFVVIIYAGQTYRPKILNSLRPSANYDKHEYIMGERFVGHAPYDEERDDVTKNKISHFSHIGIHAHEFAHLLGCYDLIGSYCNYNWDLMSFGNYNGPNYEGACPAPLNPYFRAKLGWVNVKKIDKPSINELRYNLSCPEIYWLEDQFTKKYLLIEYRKFAQEMKLGDLYVGDYNSFIGNIIPQDGLLIWKILDGGFIKLLHSCGNDCTNSNHHIFPGESCTSVITPWSANGECKYGSFWIPNTKPSNNIGLEILSSEFDHYCVGFYNSNPICTSPSKPINVNKGHEENIRVNWNKNLEPDVTFYKIYKKLNNSDYYLYDSTANNYYTDYKEINYVGSDTCNYVYYKITAIDAENKESTFSAEVKISVAPRIPTKIVATNKTNNKFILEQNYPNPFNPSTTIKYFLPEASKVNLAVYDVLGNQISMLVNKTQNAGNYEVEFNITDGENIASGLYLFRMSANIFVDVKKGIVLK